ncbi:YgfZ/GcvT domain-containing protein [Haematomicrobium sanguinis]|uniref:CAF17-like 4Fe-4S cluster assembly/insertion protein YgfZ n=1 Tax=Haematomicrobium sanguinis TaxID=479106 RepID=UPI00047BB700|nr:folate-binding protein YgfZ [Haematomicrobium sanguinis]
MEYTSPLLEVPGAVAGSGADAGVAAHYGNPLMEQRALVRGTAVVDQSHWDVVEISGPDRHKWLTTLSSQVLVPGESQNVLLLTIQGRIEHFLRVVDTGDRMLVALDAGRAPALVEFLNSMKFMYQVEVRDAGEEFAVVQAARDTVPLESVVFTDPWPEVAPGGVSYAAGADHPEDAARYLHFISRARLADLPEALATANLTLAGTMASEALRIAAWRPRFSFDVDDKSIPHELDLLRNAVHLEKGCYKGQETIARVHNLGHPPRRLVFLSLDGSIHGTPAVGSPVNFSGRTVGTVTSVGQHHEMGPIALAVIKRAVDPAADLQVTSGDDSYAAAQEVIVSPDAGRTAPRPTGFLRR